MVHFAKRYIHCRKLRMALSAGFWQIGTVLSEDFHRFHFCNATCFGKKPESESLTIVKLFPHVSSTQFVGFARNPAIRNTMFHAFFITLSKDQKHCGHFIFSYDLRCGDQESLLSAVEVDGWRIHCGYSFFSCPFGSCFLNLHIETSTDMLLVQRWWESRNNSTFFTYCVNSTAPGHGP